MIQAPVSAPHSGAKKKATPRQVLSVLVMLLLGSLALAPVANIVAIIATTGADNLSNDYLAYTGMVGDVLSGKYDWSQYFRDTFYRSHSVALPIFLHILDAEFFHWSIYPELYFGVALAGIRLLFLFQTCSRELRPALKWSLLPVLSSLVFSASQISVYAFGDAALTIGLALFGFSLGIWGLTCVRKSQVALLSMLAGGLIASFSWGNGLVSWLVFLIALPLLGYRKPWHYAVWAGGFSLSILPYVLFLPLIGMSQAPPGSSGTGLSLFNWRFVVNALGWPFSNQIGMHVEKLPEARTIGWTGIGLALAGAVLVWRAKNRELLYKSLPAFLFMIHGLVSLWQISVFRSLIAAWYSAVAINFWIGLSALALLLAQEYWTKRAAVPSQESATAGALPCAPTSRWLVQLSLAWASIVLVFMTCTYLHSNLTYEDKTDFLNSRSPASASALRNYRSAPTYAEGLLFQWGAGDPHLLRPLALPLERHQLSAFAPNQTWTLQGDFLLDRVKVQEHSGVPDIIWTAGTGVSERLPWHHYKHLNLLMAAPNTVTWTVDLPADLHSAEFLSAATMSKSAPKAADADGAWCKIDVRSEHAQDRLSFAKPLRADQHDWQPLKIDLSAYKGKQVTIQLSALNGKNRESDWVVYQYPRIAVVRDPVRYAEATNLLFQKPLVIAPSNTALSAAFPPTTADDLILSKGIDGQWQPDDHAKADTLLSQYSHLRIRLALNPDVRPRLVTAKLSIAGQMTPMSIQIPLRSSGDMHACTYDLKLLELDQSARFAGLSLAPVAGERQSVEIEAIRFIANEQNP